MNLNDLTSNQFYGGMNRRFDKRAKRLRKLGFNYEIHQLDEHDKRATKGVFCRRRYGRMRMIFASELMTSCNRLWIKNLQEHLH